MPDITITKHGTRAVIKGTTAKGQNWLEDNIVRLNGQIQVVIQADLVDDMTKDLINYGLEVDVT